MLDRILRFIRKSVYMLLFVGAVGVLSFVLIKYYSFIFSKTVEGQVLELDRVTQPTVVMGTAAVNANNVLYSFAVAIRTPTGEIYSGSSEDRQWSIVQKGLCVVARFYPYPPWDIDKAGTYYNVRMKQLKDCPPGTPKAPEQPKLPSEPIIPVDQSGPAPAVTPPPPAPAPQ